MTLFSYVLRGPVVRLLAALIITSGGFPDDSDHDGLSDALEQRLLTQFAPHFLIASNDCSYVPAQMVPDSDVPRVKAENGTIYGQVFPHKSSIKSLPVVEIHFYHLWNSDCGAHGHPLDVEHVSVLVRASGDDLASAKWKAAYWYAAAHQSTVCDVSQITRATTVAAEEHGTTVWISAGKHASFLNETLCRRGCGSDFCENMKPLEIDRIVNLGEPGRPLNGCRWIRSALWPLAVKMGTSDFPSRSLARLENLPVTDIALFHPGRHPAQGVIAISSSTADSTGNLLQKGFNNTRNALCFSISRIGKVLGWNQAVDGGKGR